MNRFLWKSTGRPSARVVPAARGRTPRSWRPSLAGRFRRVAAGVAFVIPVAMLAPSAATQAAPAPVGNGFVVTAGDLTFILKQIKIAERHSATWTASNPCGTLVGPAADQIPDYLTSYGLRTTDGSCNNLKNPPSYTFAAADQPFPHLAEPLFRSAEPITPTFPVGPTGPTSYKQFSPGNVVVDSQPRTVSNLVVDQTSTNPAAIAAAGFPVRSQGNPGVSPCTTDPDPTAVPPVDGVPAGCVPSHHTLFIPNVTTDVGLSPPFNSMFTFFGQFFDHGVDQTVKDQGTVFVPLKADDPLRTLGPDGKANTGDEVPASQAFMVLSRAQVRPGPDGILDDDPGTTVDESADNIPADNTDSPWVDQSQTYTSHSSHQVFLREYTMVGGKPFSTGKFLGGLAVDQTYPGSPDGQDGISTWASVKKQAAEKLGLLLVDRDVTNIPMLATDPYGNFLPGPVRGLPQYVTSSGLIEGDTASPVAVPANVLHFNTPFLTDIAHNADPSPQDTDHNPATPPVAPTPDADSAPSADFANQPAGTYDDELLNAHFACGDGRCNENIALSTIHQIFHSEHNRLVDDITNTLNDPANAALLADFRAAHPFNGADISYGFGGRLFQAARFVTEMEYQHLVFEEFARKMVPAIRPFHVYSPDINPAIEAEFAHAVYRFGHSMLDDLVARTDTNADGSKLDNSLPLLTAFLNPPAYFDNSVDPTHPVYSAAEAAGAVVMGSSDQTGNEIDEFVTETLRNNLLGLPLDLPTLNMTRARDAGVPRLNEFRRDVFAQTNDGQLAPYTSWQDYGQHLKHPESLVNYVAAYGLHPSITSETTIAGKRNAARAIVDPRPAVTDPVTGAIITPADVQPADAADFMFSNGAYANDASGRTVTGVDDIDLWVGGLGEVTNLFGGLLGTTFNYVFQGQLEKLQDGDRLYYLARTPGMNLRTQLEGNSFSEMIQRNTEGTNTLKADAFATADCKFQMSFLNDPANTPNTVVRAATPDVPASITGQGSLKDDPNTPDCDENLLLVRSPDGTIAYRQRNAVDPTGINGQSVYNGTAAVDRIKGGNDNDTFWGGAGNDVIDGQGGDDVVLGGDGDDIITDLDGADVPKGGPGNDAIDAGPGDDIPMGNAGQDFINAGANDNETFAGPGNDFVIAGQGADAVFGDGGDDWIEGGSGQDLLQGDHGAPFFDDPAETAPGNDIFVGQVGENDYDAEGGDDVMAQNAAVDRNAGAGGFDWAIGQYNSVAQTDDMMINNNLGGLPIQLVVNRDRWQETEADSGTAFDDSIKGTDGVLATPRLIDATTGGFSGCDAIDQAGMARIGGLSDILPPVAQWQGTATAVTALSASGSCPLTGPVWGEGDILLGGGGSDTIEGRAGDEIIDGDRYLSVRISYRTNPADPATETGTTDLMENKAIPATATNPWGAGTTGMTLQQAVFAGIAHPGNLVAVRELKTAAPDATAVDTAVFSAASTTYTITANANGSITVNSNGGA
ncbi:MAG: peroxidase family protein, partial [Terrabacter sp.]